MNHDFLLFRSTHYSNRMLIWNYLLLKRELFDNGMNLMTFERVDTFVVYFESVLLVFLPNFLILSYKALLKPLWSLCDVISYSGQWIALPKQCFWWMMFDTTNPLNYLLLFDYRFKDFSAISRFCCFFLITTCDSVIHLYFCSKHHLVRVACCASYVFVMFLRENLVILVFLDLEIISLLQ